MQEIFNQADIAANRQGRLTPAQSAFIKASADPKVWIWGVGICLGLGAVSGLVFMTLGAGSALGILGPILGLAVVFCAVRGVMIWNLRRQLLKDEVMAAEGTVTFKKLDVTDMWRYSPETADGQRLLPQGLAGVSASLPPGRYRFYYLPTRKRLLSAEPLSSEAELSANLTEVFGQIFGFAPSALPGLRTQAAAGEVKTVEGQPQTRKLDITDSSDQGTGRTEVYIKFGDVEFLVPTAASFAFITGLRYRVYYSEKKPANFLGKLLSGTDAKYIVGIEPQ